MTPKEKIREIIGLKNIGATPKQDAVTSARIQTSDILIVPELRSEVLTSAEIMPQKIREIADFFRFVFNNDWPEFVTCPPCDQELPSGMRISARDIFVSNEAISLEKMQELSPLPLCPNCQVSMTIFHDPETTESNLASKLENDGYVSLLYSDKSKHPAGFTFGYGTTLEKAFEYEWKSPYIYMHNPDPGYDRDFDVLLAMLNEGIHDTHFTPDTEVFIWNCVAITKEIRGKRNFLDLTRNLFNALPQEKWKQRVVGECIKGSTAHALFKACGAIDLEGFLGSGEITVVFRIKEMIDRLNLSESEFYSLIKKG